MSFATVTRRGFLKGACMLSGGILLGIRMTGKAAAAVKAFKEYMGDQFGCATGSPSCQEPFSEKIFLSYFLLFQKVTV